MKKIKVLLFDLDPQNRSGADLQKLLEASSSLLETKHRLIGPSEIAGTGKHLRSILARFSPDLTCLIFGSASRSVMADLFAAFRSSKSAQPIIAVVNTSKAEDVAEALYYGANDFVIPPFRGTDIVPRIWRWVGEAREEDASMRSLKDKMGLKHFVGESPTFLTEIKKIPAVARCAANVLIAGETGTGKEICARAIHYLSRRVSKPFVVVNCGAIPSELVENELFGHAPGAFTSAVSSSLGLIQEADGGTLFLDEIDALPLLAQVKLLRFLQEKEFRPLGSRKTCRADVRVIAAANVNLEEAVHAGRFRRDLYYRLNVVVLNLPPLRQRTGDVPLLSRYFVAKFTTEVGKLAKGLTPAAMQKLLLYEWPGNVRELENVIERSVVLSEHTMIEGSEIILPQSAVATGEDSFQALKAIAIADFEQKYIKQLLLSNEGNVSKAARAAGKDRRGLRRLIQKCKAPRPDCEVAPSPN